MPGRLRVAAHFNRQTEHWPVGTGSTISNYPHTQNNYVNRFTWFALGHVARMADGIFVPVLDPVDSCPTR